MPSDFTLAQEFREAMRPLIRQLNKDKTLSWGKLGILSDLARIGRATGAELASQQHISPQAVTMAVRELEDLRLVSRTPDNADRRRIWIELTDEGRARIESERRAGDAWLDGAIDTGLTEDEREILRRAIPVISKLTEAPLSD